MRQEDSTRLDRPGFEPSLALVGLQGSAQAAVLCRRCRSLTSSGHPSRMSLSPPLIKCSCTPGGGAPTRLLRSAGRAPRKGRPPAVERGAPGLGGGGGGTRLASVPSWAARLRAWLQHGRFTGDEVRLQQGARHGGVKGCAVPPIPQLLAPAGYVHLGGCKRGKGELVTKQAHTEGGSCTSGPCQGRAMQNRVARGRGFTSAPPAAINKSSSPFWVVQGQSVPCCQHSVLHVSWTQKRHPGSRSGSPTSATACFTGSRLSSGCCRAARPPSMPNSRAKEEVGVSPAAASITHTCARGGKGSAEGV